MTTDSKKYLLGTALGLLVFWLLHRNFLKKSDEEKAVPVTDANIAIATDAFTAALEAGEPQSTLNDLNSSFASEYSLRMYVRKSDGVLVVTDLSGKEIKTIK